MEVPPERQRRAVWCWGRHSLQKEAESNAVPAGYAAVAHTPARYCQAGETSPRPVLRALAARYGRPPKQNRSCTTVTYQTVAATAGLQPRSLLMPTRAAELNPPRQLR